MDRRHFIGTSGAALIAGVPHLRRGHQRAADQALRISTISLDLGGTTVRTVAYNGGVPGPLLRLTEGVPFTVDVSNDTADDHFVHWHGLEVPSNVDGAPEEGTPPVPPHGTTRYTFTPTPHGTRWYHSHVMAGHDLTRAAFSGQFGFLIIEPRQNPARYDAEHCIALHEWEPYIQSGDDGFQSVAYRHASINGRMLGYGEPIRVREGDRVLFRLLNASADVRHWLALPGHRMTVVALDGNPVPVPRAVDCVRLDPSERVDVLVEMNNPGVWVLGEARDRVRNAGMGVVIEYAGRSGTPSWHAPAALEWDYFAFAGTTGPVAFPTTPIDLAITSKFNGHGNFEGWRINGRSAPDMLHLTLHRGERYRLRMTNSATEDHPMHLHRHSFLLVDPKTGNTSAIRKDTALLEAGDKLAVEFVANNPGPTLMHCHLQDHMDAGLMMMFEYA